MNEFEEGRAEDIQFGLKLGPGGEDDAKIPVNTMRNTGSIATPSQNN